jgi:hypothetical protein
LDVVLARDPLDAKPIRRPLGERRPCLGHISVELCRAPVGAALLDAVRGKEEGGLRACEIAAAVGHSGPMGHTDRSAMGEAVAVVGVDVGADRAVARDVDVDGTVAGQRRDLVEIFVEVHRIVYAESP